jgi:succinoglycan biosynthesis protein ExoA
MDKVAALTGEEHAMKDPRLAPVKKANAGGSPERRRISIVVACRNEAGHIRSFLDSVLAQEWADFDWEVIIADGMSDDGTTQLLHEFARKHSRIRAVDNPLRIVSTGLNCAIQAAHGEIILRLDAHTEYARDYVRKCVETLDETGAENVGGPARTKAEGRCASAIQAAYHSRFSTGGARFHDPNFSGYVDTVPYGCWRKETLLRLGLFDEELVRNQDDEFNLRLTRGGGKIWQSSDIVSWYHTRSTVPALFRQYFQYGFWKVPVIFKYAMPGTWRQLVPGTFVLINLALLLMAVAPWAFAARVLVVWSFLLTAYVLSCLIATCFTAWRFGWHLFAYLPATFVAFHFSYGLGFLAGLLYWTFARPGKKRLGNVFVGVTR